ncbi:MAG: Glu-tRNA(Gln) amidotransferase subunit GatD [Candidatus Iainarchaeum archaeon]|uniref:Glutamyl-tRNA(Gln) amidotransferase subunit D n=1 Tax=Candidatus Iainarchaeum sp. TaxID=3101447 RepID=A0A7T9I2T1_9ARCH|nr:MAG: Glu-tRNA(Gln) amidotransferase subunit GatD [Candidatus Diapherotrites archaeon]
MASSLTLKEFLAQKNVQVGDTVAIEWKGNHLKALILPQTLQRTDFLDVKLSMGYNTGLALNQITSIQKVPREQAAAPPAAATPIPPTTNKPPISLVASGGTIGSKIDYTNAGVTALMTPAELLQLVPELGEFAHITSIQSPFTKLSENMIPNDWIRLAHVCAQELNKKEIRGVLLTHGTDTLAYTAAALSFFLKNISKPLILVGAQRSSDRGSSDANFNLICAARLALSDIAEVGICMHGSPSDEYCLFNKGTRVKKMHTSRRDAFRPINAKPLAKVFPSGKIETLSPYHPRHELGKVEVDAAFEENIALIKYAPGMTTKVLEEYAKHGCKGFIIEGTGLGHVPESWVEGVRAITAKGIPIFMATQPQYGRVNMSVYSTGRMLTEAGVVGLGDMSSEVAYVKLGWVLAHTQKLDEVRTRMLTPIAGEMSIRSEVDTFLY